MSGARMTLSLWTLPHLRMCHLGLLYARQRCIKCVDCRSVLSKHIAECGRHTCNALFNYRQVGGLIMQLDDVVKIVTFAELHSATCHPWIVLHFTALLILQCLSSWHRMSVIETMVSLNKQTNKQNRASKKLQSSFFQHFGDKLLFDIENHFSETQSWIGNHYFDLFRVIVDIFGVLQQHYIICLHNIGLKNHVYVKKINIIYLSYRVVSKYMFISFVNMLHFWFCRVWLTTHPSLIIILL